MDIVSKWNWKMDWCKKHGLNPAFSEVWNLAENAYKKFIGENNA